jgi:hypothetical protein
MMVAPEQMADRPLIMNGTFSGATNAEKTRAMSMNKGAPGGCPTSSLYADAMNSPQSQKGMVGSRVMKYTAVAMKNINQPRTTFNLV